ncbi:unnamed protein product [Paramecium pentaurelia]|uniref:Uncharacterized protein n=1 Tax=Paramecium pentaurelia TaxID=43138 RepID=A0A8S1YHL3_9CILI|nr:unnamed protein product [Paramecium pentaurelia]
MLIFDISEFISLSLKPKPMDIKRFELSWQQLKSSIAKFHKSNLRFGTRQIKNKQAFNIFEGR